MAYDMTVHCTNTLLENYRDKNIRIVIVDNASPNDTGKNLAAYYKEQTTVTVLFSRENVGFARGNNIGYSCLRDSCDYIIIMNNDVLIQQPNFLEKIHDLYQREQYAVLGPDIYSPSGVRKHQNPFFLQAGKKETLQKDLKAMEANNRRFLRHYMKTCMFNAVRQIPFAVRIFQFCKYRVFRHGGGTENICANISILSFMEHAIFFPKISSTHEVMLFIQRHFYITKKTYFTISA